MPKHKIDADLGTLDFQNIEGMLSYSCKVTLPISRKQVDIFFETDSENRLPTTAQKQFLQYVVDNYNNVLASIATELPREIEAYADNKFHLLQEQFDLDTLGIPSNVQSSPKWDLSLKSRSEKSMSLLANFNDMKPIKVWIENATKRPLLLRLFLKLTGQ